MTKKLLRSAIFLLLVFVLIFTLCDIFELENTSNINKRFYTYQTLPKNSVDAVYIGTSGVDRYWIASQAYEEYGMAVYPLTSDAMPAWLFVEVIKDVFAYQNPELIILDIRTFGQNNVDASRMEVRARRVLDAMNFFSVNRLRVALKTMKVIHSMDKTTPRFDLSLLLSYIKYHTKWNDDDFLFSEHAGNRPHNFAGFFLNEGVSFRRKKQTPVLYDPTYEEELDPISEAALYEVLEFIEEKELNVLFVDTPQFRNNTEAGRSNKVYHILEENGFSYLHYYSPEDDGSFNMGLDPKSDFYNTGHVNVYGAQKFTSAFSAYLNDNYDLPDRRNDENAAKYWNGINEKLTQQIAEYAKEKKKSA